MNAPLRLNDFNFPPDETDRTKYLGGSEVPALFGLSPWLTRWELYHRKIGTITDTLGDTERMAWGRRLQPVIAEAAAEAQGYDILVGPPVSPEAFVRDESFPRLGGHPDNFIRKQSNGALGVLEIKNCDSLVFKKWGDENFGEPPVDYQMQPQVYGACARSLGLDVSFVAIAVLVGGNSLEVFETELRPRVAETVRREAVEFWRQVDARDEPDIDWESDSAKVIEMYQAAGQGFEDMSADQDLYRLCKEYKAHQDMVSAGGSMKQAVKAKILTRIHEFDKVRCGEFSISARQIGEKEIAAYTCKGYRDFRINEKKAWKEEK